MHMPSDIKFEKGVSFYLNYSVLEQVIVKEGKAIQANSKRLVSSRTISKAGGYSGSRTGRLKRTIVSKKFTRGLGVYVTHRMRNNEVRYPFILVNGRENMKPRADHIETAFNTRRNKTISEIQSVFKKSLKTKYENFSDN